MPHPGEWRDPAAHAPGAPHAALSRRADRTDPHAGLAVRRLRAVLRARPALRDRGAGGHRRRRPASCGHVAVIGSHGQTVAHRPAGDRAGGRPPPSSSASRGHRRAHRAPGRLQLPRPRHGRRRPGCTADPLLRLGALPGPGPHRAGAPQRRGHRQRQRRLGRARGHPGLRHRPGKHAPRRARALGPARGGRRFDRDGALARAGAVLPELLEELLRPPLPRAAAHRGRPDGSSSAPSWSSTCCSVGARAWRTWRPPRPPSPWSPWPGPWSATCSPTAGWRGCGSAEVAAAIRSSWRGSPARLAPLPVATLDALGFPEAAREAACFALLASEFLEQVPANVPPATGARTRVVLGQYLP